MLWSCWIAGVLLAWLWFDRLRDALRGAPTLADIAKPEWDVRELMMGRDWEPLAGAPAAATFSEEHRAAPAGAPGPTKASWPRLAIIVPARNEQEKVEQGLTSLLALDYPNYQVIAINDRSTDATGQIMQKVAGGQPALRSGRLKLIQIEELPPGWLGKPHAMWLAAQQAPDADWLLFTDADVVFRPDCLRRAIAYAERERADHLVLFPTYNTESFGERIMLSGFSMLFVFGHRPWAVANPDSKDFMGLGPFNLIRRRAYEQIGTFAALRMEVIEDMKLGKLVKQHRLAQRNVFGPGLLPWKWGKGAFGLVRNLTKNMFALMEFRWAKAIGACVLLAIFGIGPFLGLALAPAWSRVPFAAAVACIAVLYAGLAQRLKISPLYFILHPVGTLLLIYTMLRSMAHAARHRGVVWRGTRYSLEELRRGLV